MDREEHRNALRIAIGAYGRKRSRDSVTGPRLADTCLPNVGSRTAGGDSTDNGPITGQTADDIDVKIYLPRR